MYIVYTIYICISSMPSISSISFISSLWSIVNLLHMWRIPTQILCLYPRSYILFQTSVPISNHAVWGEAAREAAKGTFLVFSLVQGFCLERLFALAFVWYRVSRYGTYYFFLHTNTLSVVYHAQKKPPKWFDLTEWHFDDTQVYQH